MKKLFTLLAVLLIAGTVNAQQLYLCGDSPIGNGWDPTVSGQVPMTLAGDGYTNTASFDIVGSAWFCVSIGGGNDWNDYNGNYRYSFKPASGDDRSITASGDYQLTMNGDYANQLVAGHYDLSIDARTMVLTITYSETAAPAETTYSVVGDTGLGLAWDPANGELVMEKKSETLYELTRENVELEAGKDYYWRILEDATTYGWSSHRYGASGYDAGEGDDNIVSQFETGVYTLKFTLDLSDGNASVPKLEATKTNDINYVNYTVYVDDQTGWASLKLYAWGDGGEIFGYWSQTSVTGSETKEVNGVVYYAMPYQVKEDAGGVAHLIFFDGDNDTGDDDPTRANIEVPINGDTYVKVESGHAEIVTPGTTGVGGVKLVQTASDAIYNMAGQRVSNEYKGIVIKNGKKFFRK